MTHLRYPAGRLALTTLAMLLPIQTSARSAAITNGLAVYLNFDGNILGQAGTAFSGTVTGFDPTEKYTTGIVGAQAAVFNNDGTGTTPSDWAVSLGDIETIYAGSWSFSLWINATNANDGALLGNKDWTSGGDIGRSTAPATTSAPSIGATERGITLPPSFIATPIPF